MMTQMYQGRSDISLAYSVTEDVIFQLILGIDINNSYLLMLRFYFPKTVMQGA